MADYRFRWTRLLTMTKTKETTVEPFQPFSGRRIAGLGLAVAGGLLLGWPAAGLAQAEPRCTFLNPIGGNGMSPIVAKSVGRGKLFGKSNWNTDFIVDKPFTSFKFFFTANSSDAGAKYPVEAFMKFSDGSSLQVVNETMNPPIGTGRMFGPFPAIEGKQASQMNFKVGASKDPGALGFSYRISVQGCL
ncbi:hypothetical protein ICNINCKA_00957 [Synechococcus sp. CBW1107]|nr:hypothetical protein ICNINCKA_00957 [Synechococcus sp. CBW1107]